ncbi:MAG: type IV pilus assembly protein PilM [Selenomonadales bacterium]|nr:type IV pilus assembly protein PilM [Selenomonadales bacterium]
MHPVTQENQELAKVITRSERNRAARVRRSRKAWGVAVIVTLALVAAVIYAGTELQRLWHESALWLTDMWSYAQQLDVSAAWLWVFAPLAFIASLTLGVRYWSRARTPLPPPAPTVKKPPQRGLFARPVLGIDVGNSQIKMVEVVPGQPPRVLRYAVVPTPRGSVENGLIRDAGALSAAISEAVSRGGFTTRRAATTLTGQNLMLRKLTLPPMPKQELRAAIDWQIEQVLQLNREDTLTDFAVMPARAGEPNTLILVAMQREPIINFVDFMTNAGFEIIRVDIEPLAMFRSALLATQSQVKRGTHVVLDFGAGTTNLSVFREGVLQTARVIALGGNQLTRAIMVEHQLDFEQAEKEKIEHGLTPDCPYFSLLAPVRDRLFGEINTTVNFYLTENKGVTIDTVQVAGGNSLLPFFTAQLEESIRHAVRSDQKDFRVNITNPLTRMAHGVSAEDLDWCGASLCVAIGLALGEVVL